MGIGGTFVNNVGGGIEWDNGERVAMPNSGGGAYLFFDAVYAEVVIGYNFAGGKFQSEDITPPFTKPTLEHSYTNVGVFLKYPIHAGNITVFPLVGMDWEETLTTHIVGTDFGDYSLDLNSLWLKVGAGVEADLSKRLYIWKTATDKNVCPSGWRLPYSAEFGQLLVDASDKTTKEASYNLKSTGWKGSDKVGFAALPGGYRQQSGSFNGLEDVAAWWTSSIANTLSDREYYAVVLRTNEGTIGDNYYFQNPDNPGGVGGTDIGYGLSVRCVQDK